MANKIKENLQRFLIVWLVVLIANQILLFGGCLALYCLIAAVPHTLIISLVISYYWSKADENDAKTKDNSPTEDHYRTSAPKTKRRPTPKQSSSSTSSSAPETWKKANAEDDVMKKRGDGYELHIGRKFELKGDLVIYNGLIRGFEDQGVDVIVISRKEQSINLIQCKHWKRHEFAAWHLKKIYDKLNNFSHDYQNIDPNTINKYLSIKHKKTDIIDSIHNASKYQMRKTLYLSNSSVIQSDAWHLLNKINGNIYRYQDMKIVIHGV